MTAEALAFLGGQPERTAIFEAVEATVAELGESAMEVKRSQISWKAPRLFAALSLPLRVGRHCHPARWTPGRKDFCLFLCAWGGIGRRGLWCSPSAWGGGWSTPGSFRPRSPIPAAGRIMWC